MQNLKTLKTLGWTNLQLLSSAEGLVYLALCDSFNAFLAQMFLTDVKVQALNALFLHLFSLPSLPIPGGRLQNILIQIPSHWGPVPHLLQLGQSSISHKKSLNV